jgi:hypothetical protein
MSEQCPLGFICLNYGGTGVCRNTNEAFGGNFSAGDAGVDQGCSQPSTTPPTTNQCHSTIFCASPGHASTCTDTCGTDFDCYDATSQASNDNWVCSVGNYVGGARGNFCSPPQSSYDTGCCSDSDCPNPGEKCHNPGFLCFNGGTCYKQSVGDSCSSDQQCDHGFCEPTTGRCTEPCCGTYDCSYLTDSNGNSLNWTCAPHLGTNGDVFKICQPGPSGATADLDQACDPTASNTTCMSGYCFYDDPVNPSTAGYCTSPCCTDYDCYGVAGSTCQLFGNGVTYPDGGLSGYMGFCVKR